MIQVCVHDLWLVYHICHADVECQDFKDFLESNLVKFVTVNFGNDKEVLCRIGLVVGNTFDLQKNRLAGVLSSAFNADPGRSHGSSFVR